VGDCNKCSLNSSYLHPQTANAKVVCIAADSPAADAVCSHTVGVEEPTDRTRERPGVQCADLHVTVSWHTVQLRYVEYKLSVRYRILFISVKLS